MRPAAHPSRGPGVSGSPRLRPPRARPRAPVTGSPPCSAAPPRGAAGTANACCSPKANSATSPPRPDLAGAACPAVGAFVTRPATGLGASLLDAGPKPRVARSTERGQDRSLRPRSGRHLGEGRWEAGGWGPALRGEAGHAPCPSAFGPGIGSAPNLGLSLPPFLS